MGNFLPRNSFLHRLHRSASRRSFQKRVYKHCGHVSLDISLMANLGIPPHTSVLVYNQAKNQRVAGGKVRDYPFQNKYPPSIGWGATLSLDHVLAAAPALPDGAVGVVQDRFEDQVHLVQAPGHRQADVREDHRVAVGGQVVADRRFDRFLVVERHFPGSCLRALLSSDDVELHVHELLGVLVGPGVHEALRAGLTDATALDGDHAIFSPELGFGPELVSSVVGGLETRVGLEGAHPVGHALVLDPAFVRTDHGVASLFFEGLQLIRADLVEVHLSALSQRLEDVPGGLAEGNDLGELVRLGQSRVGLVLPPPVVGVGHQVECFEPDGDVVRQSHFSPLCAARQSPV